MKKEIILKLPINVKIIYVLKNEWNRTNFLLNISSSADTTLSTLYSHTSFQLPPWEFAMAK